MNAQGNFHSLLKGVSRSFYLTLRVLPQAVRRPIGLAYLLARATDTIADTPLLPVDQRLAALRRLCDCIQSGGQEAGLHRDFAAQQSSSAEAALLGRIPDLLVVLGDLPARQAELIRALLETITQGQELDLLRFAAGRVDPLASLRTEAELDDYTYLVAGCVGPFWTQLCRTELFPKATIDEAALMEDSVHFGKGLQLVNILRDLAVDLRQGRCYVPSESLESQGLTPADLLDPTKADRFRALYSTYLERAEDHLEKGWRYTNRLPRSSVRVVLACAWPILIGIKTIGGLRRSNPLAIEARVKVKRSDVRSIMAKTVLWYPYRSSWEALWNRFRDEGAKT